MVRLRTKWLRTVVLKRLAHPCQNRLSAARGVAGAKSPRMYPKYRVEVLPCGQTAARRPQLLTNGQVVFHVLLVLWVKYGGVTSIVVTSLFVLYLVFLYLVCLHCVLYLLPVFYV